MTTTAPRFHAPTREHSAARVQIPPLLRNEPEGTAELERLDGLVAKLAESEHAVRRLTAQREKAHEADVAADARAAETGEKLPRSGKADALDGKLAEHKKNSLVLAVS